MNVCKVLCRACFTKKYAFNRQFLQLRTFSPLASSYKTRNLNFKNCGFMSFLTSKRQLSYDDDEDNLGSEYDQMLHDESHEKFTRSMYFIPGVGHRIFLVQPYLKQGAGRVSKDDATIKMVEAHALIETLNNWKVVDKTVLATKNMAQKYVFGSGNIESLGTLVSNNPNVSAVFINIEKLSGLQYSELSLFFGLPVYDRYSIVLQIFKDHSRSRVSKLQIAVAEIPYLRSRLKWYQQTGRKSSTEVQNLQFYGGAGETSINQRREMLEKRELKLREVVTKLKTHRQLLRQRRVKLRVPTIAVVGYTNAGKTSLIKSLTGDVDMVPVNHLFATLDVTVHGGRLPSRLQVVYVDTVGFISEIPTTLIESFHSTLEDATLADVIVHVRDLSHPETDAQKVCVLETLRSLNLPPNLHENIIEVGNKIDLVPELDTTKHAEENTLLVSATNGTGLLELQKKVERRLFQVRNINAYEFHVPNGGEASRWLYKQAAVNNAEADSGGENLIMNVVIDNAMLSKFHTIFPDIEIVKSI